MLQLERPSLPTGGLLSGFVMFVLLAVAYPRVSSPPCTNLVELADQHARAQRYDLAAATARVAALEHEDVADELAVLAAVYDHLAGD